MERAGGPLLEVRGLTKRYPGGTALDGVHFDVHAGEVHCLLGANGAGKSTLIKCVSGAVEPTSGEILLDGVPLPAGSPSASLARGVATIYQELDLAPDLTVAESIYFGREPCRGPFLDRRAMRAGAKEVLARLRHEDISVDATVGELRPAFQQIVSIARALSAKARLLILDEPSAILDASEIEALFAVVRSLLEQGTSVIFISHLLGEIATIGHRVSVLRDGRTVASGLPASTPASELISLMVGNAAKPAIANRGSALLEKKNIVLSVRDVHRAGVGPIRFDLHAGEILGIAGLVGAGRTELLRLIYGLDRTEGGEVLVSGASLPRGRPDCAIDAGMGFIPEDRKAQGLLLDWGLAANASLAALPQVSRFGWIDVAAEQTRARGHLDGIATKYANIEQPVRELSGGNQQKVLFCRWLFHECRILLLDEPTRGVDVGARAEIYRVVGELAAKGMAVIVVSSDLSELVAVCTRILVMREGAVVAEVDGAEATEPLLLRHCVEATA
ncbi:sugar ABC transporter ATP-binding protein [Pendulispora brunnea]|uniref:Sugar ABC transporter ATP-binding protein n=1 Tax=Pendulispora brunnea TaxID=2905690 RepID=A0ABZ2K8Z9_9BACT